MKQNKLIYFSLIVCLLFSPQLSFCVFTRYLISSFSFVLVGMKTAVALRDERLGVCRHTQIHSCMCASVLSCVCGVCSLGTLLCVCTNKCGLDLWMSDACVCVSGIQATSSDLNTKRTSHQNPKTVQQPIRSRDGDFSPASSTRQSNIRAAQRPSFAAHRE